MRGKVPPDLEVRQVYGIVFSTNGGILLRVDQNQYKLTGGKPEERDLNFEETLKREYIEELNVEIDCVHYLGYLLVLDGDHQYAQVRMIAKIRKIGAIRPDLDGGKIYQRFLADFKNVKKYLAYPDIAGNQLIDDAVEMAREKYSFSFEEEEYFI